MPAAVFRFTPCAVPRARSSVVVLPAVLAALSACSSVSLDRPASGAGAEAMQRSRAVQAGLAPALQVPESHVLVAQAIAVGRITYECRSDAAGGAARWQAVTVEATVKDGGGRSLGQLSGPPAVWSFSRGGRIEAGRTLAEIPRAGALPAQLLEVTTTGAAPADPAAGLVSLAGVDRVQQLATRSGVPREAACTPAQPPRRDALPFQADYNFWRPAAAARVR